MIQITEKDNFEQISLENDFIKVIFLPQIGGKMIKLINKKTGTNFLLEPQNNGKGYKPAYHGASFDQYDTSGFDECFPTVEASTITTESGSKISFPDHGQLWSKPWQYKITEDETLIRTAKGVNWNYSFTKKVHLEENKFIIDYIAENYEDESLPYIWSAQPLLNVEPGDEIYLPDEINEVMLGWSSDEKIGRPGNQLTWPNLDGRNDFSTIQDINFAKAVKVFSKTLNEFGWCAFHKIKNKESLLISFDTTKIPYLGIWLTYGGWPVNRQSKHLTIALEPTNACCDSLEKAMENKSCGLIKPMQKNEWRMEFTIVNE